MSTTRAAAAELALTSYISEGTPEIARDASKRVCNLRHAVNLTEAPEDAVCSLVVDLMHYCDRERIDWSDDVLLRARERFAAERKMQRRR